MRQVSAALAEAIEAAERTTRLRVSVDWASDGHGGAGTIDELTGRTGTVQISRILQADIPDEVRTVEGSVVADLSVDLVAGDTTDERQTAARYYSRFNAVSPLYGLERIGRDVRVDAEVLTGDGWQGVPRMRGQVRGMPVSAGDLRAVLSALDYRDRMRARVTLPAVIAEAGPTSSFPTNRLQRPGLEPTWVVSWVCAQNGVYVSPPPRAGCRLWIPFHGSAFPFLADVIIGVGTADWTDTTAGTSHTTPTFGPGPYLLGLNPTPAGYTFQVTATTTRNVADPEHRIISANGHKRARIEFWARTQANATNDPVQVLLGTSPSHQGHDTMWLRMQPVTSQLELYFDDGTSTATVLGPVANTHDGAWHFFGAWFDTSTGRAVFRVDNVTTVVTFTPMTPAAWLTTDEAYDTYSDAAVGCALAELQVTGGTAESDPWLPDIPWTLGAVIDRCTVPLQGIALPDPQDSWDVLDTLAKAVLGAVWWDEDGVLQWATSARLTGAAAQTVQRTLTSARDIVDLAYEDRADTVRNRVRCPYSPIVFHPAEKMWSASSKISVPAGSSTTVYAEFNGQFVTTPLPQLSANTAPDGSGVDISGFVSFSGVTAPTSRTAIYTLTNAYSATAWLVDTSGNPALSVAGDWIEQTSGAVTPDLADAAVLTGAVAERPLELDANPWRQTREHAAGVAMALLCQLRDPQQPITRLEVPADPRLEFYDRVRVQDRHQTQLDTDYWITGIDETADPDGSYMQQISARQARDRHLPGAGAVGVDLAG